MNKFLKFFFPAAGILAIALIIESYTSSDLVSHGSVKLTSLGTSSLALKISKSYTQPYRLQFQSPGIIELDKMSEKDDLEVFLENNDELPLIIYLNSKNADITIAPNNSERIFTGTFKGLLLAGNSECENFTIRSSNDRIVHATLKFIRLTGNDPLTIEIRSWCIHYGL